MNPYFYRVNLDRVIDGDTVSLIFDLGFEIAHRVRVRMMGYDAPETWRPKSEVERVAGHKVKNELTRILELYARYLYCQSTSIDLYGRASGIIYYRLSDAPVDEYVSINDMVLKFMFDNQLMKGQLDGPSA